MSVLVAALPGTEVYQREMEHVNKMTKEELMLSLRRNSKVRAPPDRMAYNSVTMVACATLLAK